MLAAQQGHETVVSVLHRVAGASVHHVNNEGVTAMHMAATCGHVGVVRYLLRARDNPNVVSTYCNGSTPLTFASSKGNPAVVLALIEGGANVNYSRSDGATSLILAAQNGHIEVVRALLAANADPRIVSHKGNTAFSLAKAQNHPVITALLEARLAELAATALAPAAGAGSA